MKTLIPLRISKKLAAGLLSAVGLLGFTCLVSPESALAQFRTSYSKQPQGGGGQGGGQRANLPGGVYPQFRSKAGVIRWIPDQMPLKVYVSHGITLDSVLDKNNVPACNVNVLDQWPDVVANVLEHPEQLQTFPLADGYNPSHLEAATQGINSWKAFEKEGLYSFNFTDDAGDADIYVFWTNHFVNNLGLGLFANDIRGYTAKRSFWYREILQGKKAQFRPVIVMLRTTDSAGHVMPFNNMKSSAAHEFGHALGIEGHSANAHDLMSIYYGNGTISANDAATIRYLYHINPDLIP
jgi:predicted Zn-dependent protease